MPRESKLCRWKRDDGKFRVVVFARSDGGRFRVESGRTGARLASTAAADEPEAIALAEAIWLGYQRGALETAPPVPETIAAMVDKLCDRDGLGPKTRKVYRRVWDLFKRQLGEGRQPSRIYPLDVRTFLGDREPSTHNTYLRTLRATLRQAVAHGWLLEDPTAGIKFAKEARQRKWMSPEEHESYLLHCTPGHRIRSEFVLETGLREAEIAAARWDWIHGQVGMKAIRVAADPRSSFVPKWGTEGAVPLSVRAVEVLDEARAMWPGHDGGDFIFSADGLSALGNLARATRIAVARSGVFPIDFHGLRHSAAVRWLERGASIYEVSKLLRHSDPAVTAKTYAGVTERHLVAVMARMEPAGRSPERSPERRVVRKKLSR